MKPVPDIQRAWEMFRNTFTRHLSKEEQNRLRVAFFSGISIAFKVLIEMPEDSDTDEPTAEDMRRMDALHAQIEKFDEQADEDILRNFGIKTREGMH